MDDLERSQDFYARWFGFGRVLADYPDGTRFITDATGFELALHAGSGLTAAHDWHFGFVAEQAAEVRDLLAAMTAAGVSVEDAEDTEAYVGFKCRDPDGHVIEVYAEARP